MLRLEQLKNRKIVESQPRQDNALDVDGIQKHGHRRRWFFAALIARAAALSYAQARPEVLLIQAQGAAESA